MDPLTSTMAIIAGSAGAGKDGDIATLRKEFAAEEEQDEEEDEEEEDAGACWGTGNPGELDGMNSSTSVPRSGRKKEFAMNAELSSFFSDIFFLLD
jgi:hypothetical protein